MKNIILGISIYPEKVGKEKTIQYINESFDLGFSRIFVNLLEIKNNNEGNNKIKIIAECLKHAKKLGMQVIADVNTLFYKEFNYDVLETSVFLDMGVTGIRLDEDFKGKIESKLSKKILIELNASSGIQTAKSTLEKGGNPNNIIACHNFYPQEFTGLDYEEFIKLSKWYKDNKIKVAAFITLPRDQKTIGAWKTNEGMPTIEEHRNATLSEQIRHFISMQVVDNILLSQYKANKRQLNLIQKLLNFYENNNNLMLEINEIGGETKNLEKYFEEIQNENLNIIYEIEDLQKLSNIEKFISFNFPHIRRSDISSYSIRSTLPRICFKNKRIKPRKTNKKYFKKGDVVILNDNYGRYNGELHIILKKIHNIGKRNYIGKIKKFDHLILKYNKSKTRYKLIKKI